MFRPILVAVAAAALAASAAHAGAAPKPHPLACPSFAPAGAYLAAWAPAGTSLAVAAVRGADPYVRRLATDGSVTGELADMWESPARQLSWSPNGVLLAVLKRSGEIDVAAGASPPRQRQLVSPDPSPRSDRLSLGGWSADGSQLVYSRAVPGPAPSFLPTSAIFVVDVATGTQRKLGDGFDAAWSPDGRWIAYMAPEERPSATAVEFWDLRIVHPDGTGPTDLVTHETALSEPFWSPDSSQVGYLWNIDIEAHVLAVDLATRTVRDVAQSNGPVFWTPRGLVLTRLQEDGGSVVAIVDPDTHRERGLSRVPTAQWSATPVTVSPDGASVVYVVTGYETEDFGGLRVVGTDGRGDRTLQPCVGTGSADRISGSPLADTILAEAGNDVVDVRGGGVDTVRCGRGRDVVYADRADLVARDCERVIRARR